MALVFHPKMRDGFEMTCEGLGEFRGQPTWLVYFKQREDRPAQIHDYRVGGVLYSLKLKGRAWITADKFQIRRIESELVNPIPEIRLAGEHQVVDQCPSQNGMSNCGFRRVPKSTSTSAVIGTTENIATTGPPIDSFPQPN